MNYLFANYIRRFSSAAIMAILVFLTILLIPTHAAGEASLNLGPSTGTFVVDSTFDVSVFMDTQGQSINAVELSLRFAPEKLQLISSSTGKSVIGIWPTLPKFNNEKGTVDLVGGVPGGIVASRGLITTLTFRAKSVGSTILKIDSSRILFNDGSGTEALVHNNGAIYQIILPPPAGPVVVSDSHAEQGKWYRNNSVSLQWGDEGGVEGFSYMLSDQVVDVPDDVSEGVKKGVVYSNVSDGRHYFHIKGLRNGQWGGTTHYAINIDTAPPADFKIDVVPSARTARLQPVIQFGTTDAQSGIDHYELKLIALQNADSTSNQPFFIEATSPYVTGVLSFGKYDAIIRAYDLAGNVRESAQRIQIVPALFQSVADKGLVFKSSFVLPWWGVWAILILLLLFLLWLAYWFKKRHDRTHHLLVNNVLTPELENQLSKLQKYRERYGKTLLVILAVCGLWLSAPKIRAADDVLNPPLITTVSKNISNDEIFYVGGKSGFKDAQVVILIENEQTGATLQEQVTSDSNGDWFYQYNGFLAPGNYLLWGQTKLGAKVSPPSPQVKLLVEKKALQIGSAKLTYTSIYVLIILMLLFMVMVLVLYIIYHHRHTKKKKDLHLRNLSETEHSIRRGFALLTRDIQEELALIHNSKSSKAFTAEERRREEMILSDLDQVQQYVGKEIWDKQDLE